MGGRESGREGGKEGGKKGGCERKQRYLKKGGRGGVGGSRDIGKREGGTKGGSE